MVALKFPFISNHHFQYYESFSFYFGASRIAVKNAVDLDFCWQDFDVILRQNFNANEQVNSTDRFFSKISWINATAQSSCRSR